MNLKRLFAAAVCGCFLAASLTGCGASGGSSGSGAASGGSSSAAYPIKDIQASVMWSAGGVCDITSRAIGAAAQDLLGKSIIFTNRAGSGGAVSTTYVSAQAADGYELLFGAENPQIAKVMGTSEIDYDDFIPINLFCTSYAVVCVSKDSPYQTMEELADAVLAAPGQVIMATTGAGGLPDTVASMFEDVVGMQPNKIPFDGESECLTAIMGGNADYSITTLGSAASFYQSGDIRLLSMVSDTPVEGYEDVPAVTDSYADFAKYLPWGPFYGVFVKAGTDQAVVDQLTEVFHEACNNSDFLDLIAAKGCFKLDLSGQDAVDYLKNYRSVTSWLLYSSGAAANSPADFGIEQP